MQVKKIFGYFGSKYYMVNDIITVINHAYKKLGIQCIIDVFGGSGTVLFSIPKEWKLTLIYNDLDKYLYNIFKVLQNNDLKKKLIEKWEHSFIHQDIYYEFRDELFKNENFDFITPNVDVAFKWLYIAVKGYSGIASKDSTMPLVYNNKKKEANFDDDVIKKLKYWQVCNKDYRNLIKNANKESVFLYLDPPYLQGGKRYNKGGWTIDNFKELKQILDDFKGYWLLNESSIDKISNIFGKPKIIKEYANHAANLLKKSKRQEGFWSNF